jgi:APA family basic amino acid/polyamine antiporter
VAEMPQAAAKDRLFPAVFARTRRGIPVFGIVSSTVLASVLTVISYTSFDAVFTTLVLLSVFTAVVPYLFSAGAQLFWLLTRGRETRWPHLVRDCGVSVLALVFSFWGLAGSGYQAVYYGTFCLLLGVPIYIWLKVGRHEYGEGPAPRD